jgi:hypothetical protein
MKIRILEQLGQSSILLPKLIREGLAANDRVKVRLGALQAARQHARDPTAEPIDLSLEARGTGLDPTAVRTLVSSAREVANQSISAPGLGSLKQGILGDVNSMIRAVAGADLAAGEEAAGRLSLILLNGPLDPSNEIEIGKIAELTSVSESGAGLHRLIMDLHKALNRLAAGCAEEIVEGAHGYGLDPIDRLTVAAFMRGVGQTRDLKFNHPGLETTATRAGPRLILQNDIGETDAHVVVIAVEGNVVTVTYTDVHRARARFFTGLFNEFPVTWSGLDHTKADGLGVEGAFYLVTGCLHGASNGQRDGFLEAIGAALVFLIDWNKARKVLRTWVSRDDSIRILDWAARNRVGHRGLLELGGSDLVAAAVRHAARTRIGFGERLDSALGRDSAVHFLKTVLRVSTETLLHGRSARLARDRIEAELVRHLERVDSTLLAIVVRQAGLAREIAAAIEGHITGKHSGQLVDGAVLAAHGRRLEEKADRIAIGGRSEVVRCEGGPVIERLVDRAEEAIDDLEQAAFIASLMPAAVHPDLMKPLTDLCATVIASAEAAASGADAAAEVPEGKRVDSEDALAFVARLIDLEHMADASEREVTSLVLRGQLDLPISLSVLELARALERATDRLAGFGHLLRQRVLADLST